MLGRLSFASLVTVASCAGSPTVAPTPPTPPTAPTPPATVSAATSADAPSVDASAAVAALDAARGEDVERAAQPLVPKRTLVYREVFTGTLPARTQVQTWTLVLGEAGRFELRREQGEAAGNSLIAGHAKPLGPVTRGHDDVFAGSWTADGKSVDLAAPNLRAHCAPGTVMALQPGAELVVSQNRAGESHAVWRPVTRRQVDVLRCDRAELADAPTWTDEPQPADVPFADSPGIEYAHDNDDMVVQRGGLRRLAAP